MNDLVGRTLGRYKIISLLGEGGMGAVFKGEDPTLKRVIAVKVMHPHLARQPGFAERFLQEARSAARLDHPGIVKVYEFNQADDLLFIVMEFIPGDNLRQMLQDLQSGGKWLTLAEAVDISRQLALALDYAHRQGVLHRDIKPDNIMLKSATSADLTFQPVITDLGLAKLREGGVQTEHGTSLGTPAYMSPEQAMGQPVDARSDVYALGILLYELAVGRLPFVVKTISEAVAAHLQLTPPLPRTLRPDLPAALEQIILRALAKDPADRYPTAAAFADALARSAPDVTLIAGAPPTLVAGSLATQYQTSLLRPHGPSLMGGLPTPPGTGMDRLVIRGPDNAQRIVAIETTELTVGRSSNATIVLDDPKVSRSHAKITFDGARYQVLDLDSTNGTQMANARLLAGVPQEWTPENGLRIGDHWLFLQRGDQQPAAHPDLMNGTVVDVVMPEARASQPVAIFIEPARLAVEAGGAATASLTLTNQGQVVDHLTVAVDGVPVSWLPATLPAARLMPGEQKTLTLTIAPPRSVESRAGDYPLTIRVASQSASGQAAEIAATLSIAPYRQYQSQLKPEQLQSGASGQVVVQNQGNSDETYAITWSDRADELIFEPAQAQLTVPSGQANSAIYTAGPRKRRWIGGRRQHPFSVQVTPPQGPPQNPQGAIVSSGRLPPWLPPLLIFLCLALAAAAAFGIDQQRRTAERATETADARQIAQVQTATAEARENISQATRAHQNAIATSAAATAEWKEILNAANQATRDALQFLQATERAVEQTRQAVAATRTEEMRRSEVAATRTEAARQAEAAATRTEAARQAEAAATRTEAARQAEAAATQTEAARQAEAAATQTAQAGPGYLEGSWDFDIQFGGGTVTIPPPPSSCMEVVYGSEGIWLVLPTVDSNTAVGTLQVLGDNTAFVSYYAWLGGVSLLDDGNTWSGVITAPDGLTGSALVMSRRRNGCP
jgi:serine/threonine protein kinase